MAKDDRKQRRGDLKALKLLQDRAEVLETAHAEIDAGLRAAKERLRALCPIDTTSRSFAKSKRIHLESMNERTPLPESDLDKFYREAEASYPDELTLDKILTGNDRRLTDARIMRHIDDFNARYMLDRWDYVIAGTCGLFVAMLDLLCVRTPSRPTAAWDAKVDGIFNRGVQRLFNALIPPDLGARLAEVSKIGSADASTTARLIGGPARVLNPTNHRLRALSHDPVLGLLFGVADMMRGTCTVISNKGFEVFQGKEGPVTTGLIGSLARMLGHLASDVNHPSARGNRGMGLPAPFMGVLRMFNGVPADSSDLGRQVEFMYVNGYDFRQFAAASIPALIVEVLMRASYAAKRMSRNREPLGQALVQTIPGRMNPRFRMMLAIGYGCMASVNAGRVYVSRDIMTVNYAAWMGLAWNGFHAVKWALLDRHLQIWDEIERKEIEALLDTVRRIENLEARAERLPT